MDSSTQFKMKYPQPEYNWVKASCPDTYSLVPGREQASSEVVRDVLMCLGVRSQLFDANADVGHWLPLGKLDSLKYSVGKIFSLPLKEINNVQFADTNYLPKTGGRPWGGIYDPG